MKRRVNSIVGLKAIIMFGLFWWHSWLDNPPFDLGARACEILFVVSGFLISYNHYGRDENYTWKQSVAYTKGKFVQMWPLHFLSFIIYIIASQYPLFEDKIQWVYAIFNLSFLQAWFQNETIFFSFNGASWFLSALLFCYFITPLLQMMVKKVRNLSFFLPATIILRLFFEYIQRKRPEAFGYVVHVNPLIRAMEYFIGMMIGILFVELCRRYREKGGGEEKKHVRFVVMSILELTSVAGYMYFVLQKDGMWMRGTFMLAACIPIFVLAFDEGIVSKIMGSKLFLLFGTIQFEFYILHQSVINLTQKYIQPYVGNIWLRAVIAFGLIVFLAYVYKKYFSKFLSKKIEWIFNCLEIVVVGKC